MWEGEGGGWLRYGAMGGVGRVELRVFYLQKCDAVCLGDKNVILGKMINR